MKTSRTDLAANTYEFETTPLVKATGFREYDARWWFGGPQYPKAPELNFLGVQALGLGLGTLIREMGVAPALVVGEDEDHVGPPQRNVGRVHTCRPREYEEGRRQGGTARLAGQRTQRAPE